MSKEEVTLIATTAAEFLSWFPEIDGLLFDNIPDIEEITFKMKEDETLYRYFIYRTGST